MKRDLRLHGLSSEHHSALVLARRLADDIAAGRPRAEIADELKAHLVADLEPHFLIEEEVLLPALASAGEIALAQRTRDEHAALRAAAVAVESGDYAQLATFAQLLAAHVRFEERELFPRCEQRLASEVLDEASRRASKAPACDTGRG